MQICRQQQQQHFSQLTLLYSVAVILESKVETKNECWKERNGSVFGGLNGRFS
jgi:hypothetical protein